MYRSALKCRYCRQVGTETILNFLRRAFSTPLFGSLNEHNVIRNGPSLFALTFGISRDFLTSIPCNRFKQFENDDDRFFLLLSLFCLMPIFLDNVVQSLLILKWFDGPILEIAISHHALLRSEAYYHHYHRYQ